MAGHGGGELLLVELAFPTRHDNGRNRVADEVGERTAFRHEAVDAQDQRHACDRHGRHDRERGGQSDEAGAGDAGSALGAQHGDEQQQDLVAEGERRVGRLGDEQCRQRHVDVGAVEVEGIAGRDDETDHRAVAAGAFHLGHQAGKCCLRRRGAEHQQQLFLDVADQRKDREAVVPCHGAQHDEHEEQ